MTEPIDLDHLNQYIAGDSALLDEIMTIFIEQAEQLSGALSQLPDDEAWHSAAHKLKGASRGVGAWKLGDLAETAEKTDAGARSGIAGEIAEAAAEAIAFARATRDRKG
ncbi:MAG: Hpt domain-containing protein [Parvularculaceae bacterium]|nr:Hpt domain-containing protein [Parvularculaceae bacterium]